MMSVIAWFQQLTSGLRVTQPQCDGGQFSDELGTCHQHVKAAFCLSL